MSEKMFVGAGAECVCGDLILDGQTVGRYRNGQFIMTEEGVAKLDTLAETVEVKPAKSKKAAAAEGTLTE